MYKFGDRSQGILLELDPALQSILNQAIDVSPYDFTLISGFRDEDEQNTLFEKGLSKLEFPLSKHNIYPSKAVDFAPYPIDWKDDKAFCVIAGIILACAGTQNVTLRWGGDWDSDGSTRDQTFMDIGHIELV